MPLPREYPYWIPHLLHRRSWCQWLIGVSWDALEVHFQTRWFGFGVMYEAPSFDFIGIVTGGYCGYGRKDVPGEPMYRYIREVKWWRAIEDDAAAY